MADLPSPVSQLSDAIAEFLSEHGSTPLDEILEHLEEEGYSLGDDPEAMLYELLESEETPAIWQLMDGGYALLSEELLDRVLTHRVTDDEVRYDFLDQGSDLSPLLVLLEDDRNRLLSNGRELYQLSPRAPFLPEDREITRAAIPDMGALVLPLGTLQAAGVQAGDVVGLHFTSRGFTIERIDTCAEPSTELMEDLARVLDAYADGSPVEIDDAVWQVCSISNEAWLAPLPPLNEMLPALGYTVAQGWLAVPGFDFPAWRRDVRAVAMQQIHNLEGEQAFAVLAMVDLYRDAQQSSLDASDALHAGALETAKRVLSGQGDARSDAIPLGMPDQVVAVLPWMYDPLVALAVSIELLGDDDPDPAFVTIFAESIFTIAPRRAQPGLQWLMAQAYLDLGATTEAESALIAAEKIDSSWPLALLDLARYASDRGDAMAALQLLRRARTPADDEFVTLMRAFQPVPRPDLARNRPCWCGSGRKYKLCHLGRERLPLDQRASWLYHKAAMQLERGAWRTELTYLAYQRLPEGDYDIVEALEDGLIPDMLLFEGGAFEEFLQQRGQLLPEDERLLAEQWLLIERSVFDVESVHPGDGLRLRDLRTGDRLDVQERTASKQLKPGDLICTRVLPAGDTLQLFGGVEPIPLHARDVLIEVLDSKPDPVDLMPFLSRRFAPPQLQNTEREPLVFCEASLRVPDPSSLAEALDGAYSRADDGAPTWHEYVTTSGMERIRATMTLDGDKLHIEANSETRYGRILDKLMQLQPGVTLTGERRRDIDEIEASESQIGSTIDLTDPQVQDAVQQMIRQQEQVWLDEPIPALAGVTPRQAAADPTRRPDLIRLLDSFPEADEQAVSMSPRRLREALELE